MRGVMEMHFLHPTDRAGQNPQKTKAGASETCCARGTFTTACAQRACRSDRVRNLKDTESRVSKLKNWIAIFGAGVVVDQAAHNLSARIRIQSEHAR